MLSLTVINVQLAQWCLCPARVRLTVVCVCVFMDQVLCTKGLGKIQNITNLAPF